eukprot:NODE_223_length_13915_cov_0.128257.p3 type:complete len:418 gc:universal NODE_223_length_13915_cov_0.128257:6394-7647(+)
MSKIKLGFIGWGEMSKMYYRHLENVEYLVNDLAHVLPNIISAYPDVKVYENPIHVAREADYLIFSVDTKSLEPVVKLVGPSIKMNAIVGGTTSIKQMEIELFEKYVPSDVAIITFHSMHGPLVDPTGMPLVFIPFRCTSIQKTIVLKLLAPLKSKLVEMETGSEHDRITADTQAVTHVSFMAMGLAWKNQALYPWETDLYVGGIENVKIGFMCRIFNSAWHVYAGLAISNTNAHFQVSQYSKSVQSLFRLMIEENEVEFRSRIYKAKEFVFKNRGSELLLSDAVLQKHSLGGPTTPKLSNSHLSLLAVVDSWYALGVSPYDHLICETPPFRLWLGIVEYLFCNDTLLELSIQTALFNKSIRSDDLAFCAAAQTWVQLICTKSYESYKTQFEEIQLFFKDKLKAGFDMSSKIITKLKK